MAQTTPYSTYQQPSPSVSDTAQNFGRDFSDTARDFGERALEETSAAAAAARDAVKEHPMATLAIVAGLAFAVGAVWKLGQSRRQSTVDSLLARLGDLQKDLPRRWRT